MHTYFICFTIVLFPDSPAPVIEDTRHTKQHVMMIQASNSKDNINYKYITLTTIISTVQYLPDKGKYTTLYTINKLYT